MKIIEIRNRWDNKVLFSVEAETLRHAVEAALKSGADLRSANLRSADLRSADLSGADLSGANLSGALNLPSNILTPVRDDIRKVLDAAPGEVGGLLQAIWSGKINGSAYRGECACLVGTIANVRGCSYDAIPDLKPDSTRPAEQWFLNINTGDTPVSSPAAAFACAVIAEWMHENRVVAPVEVAV